CSAARRARGPRRRSPGVPRRRPRRPRRSRRPRTRRGRPRLPHCRTRARARRRGSEGFSAFPPGWPTVRRSVTVARSSHRCDHALVQIDFHHATTYALARLAGFSHDEANVVAYSSQYVDDAVNAGAIEFENGASYSRISSAHKMLDYRNFEALADAVVWVPFH